MQGLISSVTDAVLGTIRSIAATVAAVAEEVASLVPCGVRVTALGGASGALARIRNEGSTPPT